MKIIYKIINFLKLFFLLDIAYKNILSTKKQRIHCQKNVPKIYRGKFTKYNGNLLSFAYCQKCKQKTKHVSTTRINSIFDEKKCLICLEDGKGRGGILVRILK